MYVYMSNSKYRKIEQLCTKKNTLTRPDFSGSFDHVEKKTVNLVASFFVNGKCI